MDNQKNRNQYQLIKVEKAIDYEHIKILFQAYQKELNRDLSFQRFEEELQNLPKLYTQNNGALILLRDLIDNKFVGCVGLKQWNEAVCEMKRLFVQSDYRNKKYGRVLVKAVLSLAVDLGYKEMWLDTMLHLKSAIGLYKKLGFVETEAYYHNPFKDVIYMRKQL